MGEKAAGAIDRALAKRGRVDAGDFRGYQRYARTLFARFRRFVYAFYDPVFFEAFCSEAPFDKIRAAVTQTLAGGVENVPFSTKVWTSLLFFAVGFDRFRRKIGLGPKPDEKKRRPEPAFQPFRRSFFKSSWTGFAPSHTAKSASAKSLPSMTPFSAPFTETTVPFPGT